MDTAVSVAFSLIVTLLFVFTLQPVALAIGLVDIPGGRKSHDGRVPVTGGAAMYLGLLLGSTLLDASFPYGSLLVGASLLIAVGVIDDRFELPPSVRLIAQTCAVLIMVYYGDGLRLSNIGEPLFFDATLGPFSLPFTILVALTVINAFNIIDGIDGLAGGVAFIALTFMAIISAGTVVQGLILLMMAAIAGFLICNLPISFNRGVKCFMGDAGSTFLGFALAWFGISLSQGQAAPMSPVAGLWLVAVPIYDVFTSMVRRLMKGGSPFTPDRDHFHHVLMREGLSPRRTLTFMLVLSSLTASVGLFGDTFMIPDPAMFLSWLACGVLYFETVRRGKQVVTQINRLVRRVRSVLSQEGPASHQAE